MNYFKNLFSGIVLIFSQAAFSAEHDCKQHRSNISSSIHENTEQWLSQKVLHEHEGCAKCEMWERGKILHANAINAGFILGDTEARSGGSKSKTQRLKDWLGLK